MTDTIRDLLISLASHMAYMQGQLEARHELDDPEDFYWYRESVLLRQKVTDALAEEPAVPEGREPVAVTGQPSDEELLNLWANSACIDDPYGGISFARAVLARWGTPNLAETRRSLGDGEVAELVATLKGIAYWKRHGKPGEPAPAPFDTLQADRLDRAAELLRRQVLVPVAVSERLPGPEDCDAEGRCWWWHPSHPESGYSEGWMLRPRAWGVGHYDLDDRPTHTHWLPAHALPVPEAE